jgi:hypothetical protein
MVREARGNLGEDSSMPPHLSLLPVFPTPVCLLSIYTKRLYDVFALPITRTAQMRRLFFSQPYSTLSSDRLYEYPHVMSPHHLSASSVFPLHSYVWPLHSPTRHACINGAGARRSTRLLYYWYRPVTLCPASAFLDLTGVMDSVRAFQQHSGTIPEVEEGLGKLKDLYSQ